MEANVSGSTNTAVGVSSLNRNTSGVNVAVGDNTLRQYKY